LFADTLFAMHPLRPVSEPVPNTWFDRLVVGAGVALGLFVVFLLVVLASAPRLPADPSVPAVHKLALWFSLAAHSVPFEFYSGTARFAYPMRTVPGWHQAFRLLPPVALILGGFVSARRTVVSDEVASTIEGAKLFAPYTLVVFVFGLLARHSGLPPAALVPSAIPEAALGSNVLITPDSFVVSMVAGVAYPIVFAGLGGGAVATLDRHLDRVESGPLHRIDAYFAGAADADVAGPAADTPSPVLAGIALTVGQLPGFLLTYGLFQLHPEIALAPMFDAFPVAGIGLFLVVAGGLGTLFWWQFAERPYLQTVHGGLVTGWVLGVIVHSIVWSTGYTVSGVSAVGLPWTLDLGVFLIATYVVGIFQSAGCALVAGLLVKQRLNDVVFRRHLY
jgi:hypothetical protein